MIFSLEKERIERCNTKRDAFVLTGCDEVMYTDTPQSIGGYLVCKKHPRWRLFSMKYCDMHRIYELSQMSRM